MSKTQIPFRRRRIAASVRLALIVHLLLCAVCPPFIRPAAAQSPPPDRRFGAVEAFWDAGSAAEAGVAWERILFYWSELQPHSADDWNGFHVQDAWLGQATSQGREVVGLLKHTPEWATDGPFGCGVPSGLDLPVDDPNNLWAVFVRRTVGMYAGRIDRWIIWNEPEITPDTYGHEWCGTMEEYYQLLKVAYLAAHQANPNVTIHLAGMTFWHDKTYLRRFLSVVVQDPTAAQHNWYFDVASVHIYFQTETVPYIINETRAALRAYGLNKPIWVNETNASPDSDPLWPLVRPRWRVSLEEQAGFLLQGFALALSAGAERIAAYKWMDAGLPPGGEPFGILRPDGSRRPAFDAYRLITTHYAGAISAREDRQPLHMVVTIDRGNLTTRVLWARTASATTVSIPALAPQARVIDQTGAEQVVVPEEGRYTLTLPGARCADPQDGCIIGGTTYLVVEGNDNPPPPVENSTPTPSTPPEVPTETIEPEPVPTEPLTPTSAVTVTAATPTLTPLPTATPTPTDMPTATPTPTETPSPTSTPTPTRTSTPRPTITPSPTSTPTTIHPTPTVPPFDPAGPIPRVWPLLVGMVLVTIFAAAVGTMISYQR